MTVKQITYRLNSPGQDYDELYAAIESLGDSVHEEDICWFVDTDDSTSDIRDQLKDHIGSNDSLLVIKKGGASPTWATTFTNETTNWLHNH